MKIRSLAMFSALVLFASSCEENVNKGTVWDDPHFIRVTSSLEPIKERGEDKGFPWALEDTISLYDHEYREVPIRNNEEGSKIFFSYQWTASAPGYAVYPRSEGTVFDAGYVTYNIPSEQSISKLESFQPMLFVGQVTGNNTAYKLNPLKNTMSQLKLSMNESTATSIKVEAIGGEPLAGNIKVDCAKVIAGEEDYWTIVDDDVKSSALVITPKAESEAVSETGCLLAGSYYVSIPSQVYSQGIRVTVERKDAETLVRVMGAEGGCVAARSEVLEFEGDLDDTLPDEFTIELVFREQDASGAYVGVWPFNEEKVATDATYTYAYHYTVDGIEMVADIPFYISGNKSAYNINKNGLCMVGKNSRITLPGISNRYLKSVKMDVVNGAAKGFVLVNMKWATFGPTVNCVAGQPGVLTFPYGDEKLVTEKDTQYYMRYTVGNTYIHSITLVFSKTLEGVE